MLVSEKVRWFFSNSSSGLAAFMFFLIFETENYWFFD